MAHAHPDPQPHPAHPPYMRVFVLLIVLTVVELLVALSPLAKSSQVLLLIALALAKATLVALYYMHLRFEGRLLRAIAIFPLVLSIILALAPGLDALSRR
jgi:cytochrome c oxidase subunit 4